MHHHRSLYLVGMIARIIKKFLRITHLEPFAGSDDEIRIIYSQIADHVLVAKSDMVSIVDSLVAPMSVVNALIVAVSRKREEEVSKTFKDLERLWDEYDVYERVE